MRPPFVRVIPAEIERYGAASAVVLAHVRYRCESDGPGRVVAGGARWWRVSYQEFGSEVGLSASAIRRALERLANALEVAHHEPREDQRRSYRIAADLPEYEFDTVLSGDNTNPAPQVSDSASRVSDSAPQLSDSAPPRVESDSCTSYRDSGEAIREAAAAARARACEVADSVMHDRPDVFRDGAKRKALAALDRGHDCVVVAEALQRLAGRLDARSPGLLDHLISDVERERAEPAAHRPSAPAAIDDPVVDATLAEPDRDDPTPAHARLADLGALASLFGFAATEPPEPTPPHVAYDEHVIDAEVVDDPPPQSRVPCDYCTAPAVENDLCGRHLALSQFGTTDTRRAFTTEQDDQP